jgi:hypothetical protein
VDNVQSGNDNCGEYYVTAEKLKELLNICERIIAGSNMVKAMIKNGTRTYRNEAGEMVTEDIMEESTIIEDPTLAEELLPTQGWSSVLTLCFSRFR